jgi:hypothetical protein
MNKKKTIKEMVLDAMLKVAKVEEYSNQFTPEDIRRFIHIAQGYPLSTFTNRRGYYCHAIKSWVGDNLLERVGRGKYATTSDTLKYVNDKNAFNRGLREELESNRLERERALARATFSDSSKDTRKWNNMLVGRTIKEMRRLTDEEMRINGFHKNPMVLFLDDGTFILPQRDDEGNDGGALYVQSKNACSTIHLT